VAAISILFRALFLRRACEREQEKVDMTRRMKTKAVGIGALLGFVLGLTSVGSGALIGLALILVFRLTPHRVVGTDVFHAAILLWTAGIAHWIGGNVDLGLMATILVGSLPGVWIGTGLIGHVPAQALRPALGCVLLGSALGVVTKAGIAVPVWAILAVPTACGVVAWLIERRRSGAPAPVPAVTPASV